MKHTFQVNLRGVIELLSNHLYSGPQVFVRELLQNGVDALAARACFDATPPREAHRARDVRFVLRATNDGPELVVEDDGVGLTEPEVHQFLATIGESSKRGAADRGDFLGQFGIGLLSGFVVSDEVRVRTRSAREPSAALEWRGLQDGIYSVAAVDDPTLPVGTRVYLCPRPGREEWFTAERLAA